VGSGWLQRERVRLRETEAVGSLPSRRTLASSRPLLSSKRRPHFKTSKRLERTKVWTKVPTVPDTKNDCAVNGPQHFIGLELVSKRVVGQLQLAEKQLRPCVSGETVASR
jgi:hypothetical protein